MNDSTIISDSLEGITCVLRCSEQADVHYGTECDLPAYCCRGTHVRSLAELGQVVIGNVKMKKGQLIVNYTAE